MLYLISRCEWGGTELKENYIIYTTQQINFLSYLIGCRNNIMVVIEMYRCRNDIEQENGLISFSRMSKRDSKKHSNHLDYLLNISILLLMFILCNKEKCIHLTTYVIKNLYTIKLLMHIKSNYANVRFLFKIENKSLLVYRNKPRYKCE